MGSREEILSAIRAQTVPPAAAPSLDHTWIQYPDRYAQFAQMIETIGGNCHVVDSLDQITAVLETVPAYTSAKQIVSLLPGVGKPNVDTAKLDTPHKLKTIDYAILPGFLGVAENGAIWVTDEKLRHRAIYFIVQHLSLVIPYDSLLNNMHEAYDRLSFGDKKFGVFISGPSKTADIEQSLVIGAHGPRSMQVFCVRNMP